jgi:hypothetical protein
VIPTRSQVEAYTADHLVDAAEYWDRLADRWQDAHWQVRNEAHSLDWEGFGGDALRARTVSDYDVASDKADQLREAATIARTGAGDISAAQRRVMYAVQDAQNAGFSVGQDLSVTDNHTSGTASEQAARRAQAQTFATDIRSRAAELAALDNKIGANITAAAGGVGATTFADPGVYHKPSEGDSGYVQFVDNHHKCTDDQADVEHKMSPR